MTERDTTRRDFLKTVAAGAALASLADGAEAAPDTSKILNYNPKMGYRKLGKTGLMISEVSLGGHGGSSADDRVPVLDKAVELGINYVDTNMADEVTMYGEAMRKAVKARRDRFYIGFGDWPVKITEEYEAQLTKELLLAEIEKRLKAYGTDVLDIWRPVGATWGPGQTSIPTLLNVNRKALDLVVAAFDTAKKQGKVRFLGISAHNPKVFRSVLTDYPQFSVIIFPYLFLTEELDGGGLLALAKQKNVGVIGLKPFGAGTTFGIRPTQINGRVDDRARILIKEMLKEPRIAAVIPGVNIPEQLEVNVRGSYERGVPSTPKDQAALEQCKRNFYAHLTPEYDWLHQWVTV